MFSYGKHLVALSSSSEPTLSDCANAITDAQAAMPTTDYVARSLRENSIPINELHHLAGVGEIIMMSAKRALAIWDAECTRLLNEAKEKQK